MSSRTIAPRYRLVQLTGASASRYALNAHGQVAFSESLGPDRVEARFFDGSEIHDLGNLGPPMAHAVTLNDHGEVAGTARASGDGARFHAFYWSRRSGLLDLGTAGGAHSSEAAVIDDRGEVTGTLYFDGDPASLPFRWRREDGMRSLAPEPGAAAQVPAVPGGIPAARSGHGLVVGVLTGTEHAFLWSAAGGLMDLGTLGGAVSGAHGVNGHGQVVGHSLRSDASNHAFLWTQDDGMRDLNALLVNAPQGLVLTLARQVNDEGEILAEAQGGGLYLLRQGRGRGEPPVLAPIVVSGILDVGQPLSFSARFTDVDRYQTHRALWHWGDGAETRGAVDENHGVGRVGANHTYRAPGLYTLSLTLRDSGGGRTVIRRTLAIGVPVPAQRAAAQRLPWDTGGGGLPGLHPPR